MAEIVFQINDLNCEKCIEKIRKALENVPGLEEFKFDLLNKSIILEGEADPIVMEQIIQETGYNPILLKPENQI